MRRSPRLLKRMLAQSSASDTPRRSSSTAKRRIQVTAEERSSKKRREDFIDAVVDALTVDHTLSGLLNVAVYEHCSDDLEVTPEGRVVVVTPNKVHYHEPAGYTSRVKMILTSTGSYCIQVN